jgi:hypothetical protein
VHCNKHKLFHKEDVRALYYLIIRLISYEHHSLASLEQQVFDAVQHMLAGAVSQGEPHGRERFAQKVCQSAVV